MAMTNSHRFLITGSGIAPAPPIQYHGRVRYTYADDTVLETTGTGTTLTVQEASQVPEDKIAGLKKIDIGSEITTIGNDAFRSTTRTSGGNSIKFQQFNGEVTVNKSVTIIGWNSFSDWRSFNKPFVLPANITEIGGGCFFRWREFNQPFILPHGLTEISENCFQDWHDFNQDFKVPSLVTHVRAQAFAQWTTFASMGTSTFTFVNPLAPNFDNDVVNSFNEWGSGIDSGAKLTVGPSQELSFKHALTSRYPTLVQNNIKSINGILWANIT